MAKSRTRRGPPAPAAATPQLFGGLGRTASPSDLLLRAKPAVTLESVLARSGPAEASFQAPGAPRFSSSAPISVRISSAQAREADRCARDGARLVTARRPTEAIPLLQRSIELKPSAAATHHDLGVALLHSGRLEQAADAFAAALRLDQSLASAHHSLAHIFDSLGQEEKAIEAYRAAVALKPDLVQPQLRLGQLYLARGRRVESAAAFRAAAAAAPGTVKGRIAEARALYASDAFDQALDATRAIVGAHPESAEAHSILGWLLGEAGLSAEAAAHHDRATELSPDILVSWSGLAINKKFTVDDGHLIARMNAALARPNLKPRHRQALHFALGKAHDDVGDYEEAMRHFEAGNRDRAFAGGLDRDILARRIDRLIEATPPGYRDRQPDAGVEDATPIFIVGMPRSGSTLTEQVLSSHPEVAAGGELGFWEAREARRGDIWTSACSAKATRRLADEYLAALRSLGPGAKRVTDKALANFMLLGFIHRVFPNATLIHCRRNPIDTAFSIFTTNFERHFAYASNRSDLVFFTRQHQRLIAHWREVLPADRFVEVDYEALIADPETHARRLIAACGLEWNDACLEPHRNPRAIKTASLWQARQPIYRTSVERWRRYEPWLGELRELAPET
jgi:tetratricopeptide (TPR) repeat protein